MTKTYELDAKNGKYMKIVNVGKLKFAIEEAWANPVHELYGKNILPYVTQDGGSIVIKAEFQKEARLKGIYDFTRSQMTDDHYVEINCTAKNFNIKNYPMNVGSKVSEHEFIETARLMERSGASGMAVGRNVWQSDQPLKLSSALRDVFGIKHKF